MQFKKIMSGIAAVAVAASCLSFAAFAETNKSGDFEYEVLSNGTVSITGYSGQDENPEIPAEIDGKSVTQIGYGAFNGCNSLIKVEIPESVTTIGNIAFSHCISLEEVVIPESVTEIGESAFFECFALSKVNLPKGLTSISVEMFM